MAYDSLSFNFALRQKFLLRSAEFPVDLFAGDGGASERLKQELGDSPTLARANLDPLRVRRMTAA